MAMPPRLSSPPCRRSPLDPVHVCVDCELCTVKLSAWDIAAGHDDRDLLRLRSAAARPWQPSSAHDHDVGHPHHTVSLPRPSFLESPCQPSHFTGIGDVPQILHLALHTFELNHDHSIPVCVQADTFRAADLATAEQPASPLPRP